MTGRTHPRTPWPALDEERDRLQALPGLGLLDTPPEERFDRVTRTAQRLLGAPIALVDGNRLWFKSHQGAGRRAGRSRRGVLRPGGPVG